VLGQAGVNIPDFHVGHSPTGEAALMVFSTDQPVPPDVIQTLRSSPGIVEVHLVSET
jgi:predicted regulator of amino acid metabolism with ACT domain